MQELIKKAEILIEALPYIQKFSGKTVVIKYGGNAMINEELKNSVMEDITLLKFIGLKSDCRTRRRPRYFKGT